jgi:hypothetical protein
VGGFDATHFEAMTIYDVFRQFERWESSNCTVRKFRVFEGTDEILRRTNAHNLLSENVKLANFISFR